MAQGECSGAKFARRKEEFLERLRRGATIGEALKSINVSWKPYETYRASHPEFQREIDLAEMAGCSPFESRLKQKALAEGDFKALIFWLMNRSHGRWQDKRTPPATVVHNDVLLTPDKLRSLEEQLMALDDTAKSTQELPEQPADAGPGESLR